MSRRALLAATLALVAALACLGRSPEVRFYTMRPVAGPQVEVPPGTAVSVGPVSFPRYLQRPQLVTRGDGSELQIEEFHRWAGGFESNVLQTLGTDLAKRLGTERVVVQPHVAPFPLTHRVRVDLQEFEGGRDAIVSLRARWIVRAVGDDERSLTGTSSIRRSGAKGFQGRVAAHDAALGALSDAIAAGIASLGPPASTLGE